MKVLVGYQRSAKEALGVKSGEFYRNTTELSRLERTYEMSLKWHDWVAKWGKGGRHS